MKNNKPNQRNFDLPSALRLLEIHVQHWQDKCPDIFVANGTTHKIPTLIKAIQRINSTNDPDDFYSLTKIGENPVSGTLPGKSELIKSTLPNEFFSVFDIHKFEHVKVDQNILKTLGIKPDDFNIKALAGLDPNNQLYHLEDVQHVIRWTTLAYATFTMQIFKWHSNVDIFRINFRASTAVSNKQELRDAKYICFEKSCMLFQSKSEALINALPGFLLNKISLLPMDYFSYVRLQFVSASAREMVINGFLYLLNLLLLGIPPKYILFLHERSVHRNITEATDAINARILQYHGISKYFNERQISEALQKTIRNRIAQVYNTWSRSTRKQKITCESDPEAIEYAKRLGILPLPDHIEELMYKSSFISI